MRRIHFLVPTAFLCTAALACGPGGASGDDDDDDDDVQIDAGFDTDGTPASEECRKMDLIFVIDDSGSMEQEQTNLASNFPAFANLLNAYTISTGETLDYRAAITTTGITADITIQPPVVPGFPPFPPIPSPQTGLDGKFRQACGMTRPWLERTDPNMASTFACAADVGTNGPAIEMPLRASQLAAMAATNPGFLVDNVTMTAGAPARVAIYVPLDSVTTDAAGITLTWTNDGLSLYRVWASENLSTWAPLDADLPGPSYMDTFSPARSRRFYRVEKQ